MAAPFRLAAGALVAALSLAACAAPQPHQVANPATDPATSVSATQTPQISNTSHGPQPPPPVTTPNPPASVARPNTITILGSGDVLLHSYLWSQARMDARARHEQGMDFGPIFAGIADVVAGADLAVCHLETPLGPANGPFTNYPVFSVPPQVVPTLVAIGYDTCSTASNHTLDMGEAGVDRTLDALDASKIKHAGSYRSAAAHNVVNIIETKGVKIAQLSYAFGFNGLHRPPGKPWIANVIDVPAILAEAKRARAAGAEIVVVSLHFGTEYQHVPNAQQLSVAKKLLASPDIDLILGHHSHVVQPFEKIGDKWVVYGHGNEVAHQNQSNDTREGLLSRFTFTQTSPKHWKVTLAEAIPIWMDLKPDRVVNIAAKLADPHTSAAEKAVLRTAQAMIRGFVYSRGAQRAGLRIVGTS